MHGKQHKQTHFPADSLYSKKFLIDYTLRLLNASGCA